MSITFYGSTGLTLYARVQTGASTFVAAALTEGTSGGLGVYTVSDAALVTAGLPSTGGPFSYSYTIRAGSPSTTANDRIAGYSGQPLAWLSGAEIAPISTPDYSSPLPTSPVANSFGEALFLADIIGGRRGTAQAGSANTITLDSGASSDSTAYVGDVIYLSGGTGGGVRGTGQRRTIIGYVGGAAKVATVDRPWTTIPDITTGFITIPQGLANMGLVGGAGVLAQPRIGADGAIAALNPGEAPLLFNASPSGGGPSITYFVRPTGSDSNTGVQGDEFLTIQHAIDVINATVPFPAFSEIDVAGVNDLGSATITLPFGCWLKGDGSTQRSGTTEIRSSNNTSTIIRLQAGSIVSDLLIRSTSASGLFGFPLGYRGNGTSEIGIFRTRNVDTISDSDGVYFFDVNGCNGHGIFENSTFGSKWDSSQLLQENSTLLLDFLDCTFPAIGPSGISSVTRQTGIVAAGGITRLWNCNCTSTAGGSGKPCYGALARGNAFIAIYGGNMSGGTGTGGDFDLATQDRGTIFYRSATLAHNSISGNVHQFEDGLDYSKVRNASATNAFTNTSIKNATDLNTLDTAIKIVTDKVGTMLTPSGPNSTFTTDAVKNAPAGSGGSTSDFDDEEVPAERTWTLKPIKGQPLTGDKTLTLAMGASPTFAVDFVNDLPTNGRVVSATFAIVSYTDGGASGGVTFGTPGREDSQAKVRITGVTPGTYVLKCDVVYDTGEPQTSRVVLSLVN